MVLLHGKLKHRAKRLQLIATSSKPGWFEEAVKVRRHGAMEIAGVNR